MVIPVYNSAPSLPVLIERLHPVLTRSCEDYEIILVNDGSQDDSWEVLRQLCCRFGQVRGIDLTRNYGQHNALLAGIRAARHDTIVTLDDDLQHPPEEIPLLLDKLAEGYDVVYGTPTQERHDVWRSLASRVTKWVLQRAMGANTARMVSAFRAFRTPLRDAFAGYRGAVVSIDVLLTWGTTRFTAIPVRHDPRYHGESTYTLSRLATHTLNMLTGFSVWPLRAASVVGFAFVLFGAGVLLYVVGRYLLQGDRVPGFPFLASMIAIFSGAQLFALGVIGEYLAGIHVRSMERPPYVVRVAVATAADTDAG